MRRNASLGPQFVRLFGPLLDALRELGGSGRPTQVEAVVADRLAITESQRNELNRSGQSRFSNQLHWARFYLVKAGYIEASERGVWSLTAKGSTTALTHREAYYLFTQVHAQWQASQRPVKLVVPDDDPSADVTPEDSVAPVNLGYRDVLLETLRALPPAGFERLCRRLLLESGFQQVHVTGRSGDGGIDGHGILQINPFVSFKVLFQCKRYAGTVSAGQVRDFRGAMTGRADKGIIMTTASFTSDARSEATRDGAPPIELVDGEQLVDLFEHLRLGLIPKKAYEVDRTFFDEFLGP